MSKWKVVISVLVVLFIISFLIGKINKSDLDFEDQIAIIPIIGVISSLDSISPITKTGAKSDTIINFIKAANKKENIKGIILEINSPGGTVIASKEIADAVKGSEKPVVALIREIGTSGGYWVASAADTIVADELSITGSIGVISSYLEFSGLLEEYGVSYERLTAGELKDIGSPFKQLSEREREIVEKKLDRVHQGFINAVAENRNLTEAAVTKAASGVYYLGEEAYDLGLVDHLGNKNLAINITKELAGIDLNKEMKIVKYKEKKSLFDVLSSVSQDSFMSIGRGIAAESKERVYTQSIPIA